MFAILSGSSTQSTSATHCLTNGSFHDDESSLEASSTLFHSPAGPFHHLMNGSQDSLASSLKSEDSSLVPTEVCVKL